MNVAQIEESVRKTVEQYDKKTFIFQLLQAYGIPKASITRLQKGDYNLSKNEDEIVWKKN